MAGGKVILMGFYKDWILLLENIDCYTFSAVPYSIIVPFFRSFHFVTNYT